MFIIKYKKIFIIVSSALILLSLISITTFLMRMGPEKGGISIDFKGGGLTKVVYLDERPSQETVNDSLAPLSFGAITAQPIGESGYVIKTRDLNDDEHSLLLETLGGNGAYSLSETSFTSIGPSVGRELTSKAITAIILISLALICFIAFAFRKVSKPVSSWKYGLIAIATLLHDVIMTIGIFTILSRTFGLEVDTLFVVAVLTILGLSVSDTIVIFDRIRENLNDEEKSKLKFPEVVGISIEQSYARSIATSLTTFLVLLALIFFGPESTKYFTIMLGTGMFFGVYSSIFLASPLLVLTEELQKKG
ncbi:MAG: protein translocase subunit SecF [Candidatus Paceibacterota bacterium]